jgi:DNA recombination protein RmuC
LEGRSQQILDVGKQISTFSDLLKAPKARGGLGEFLLGQLLAELMPREYFDEQHGFRSGERVDAVIKLGGRLVPVDAKFPLESFQRHIQTTNEEERIRTRREFERTVKTHITAIARKYICPQEDTYDFALMFVPSEQVYYETIVRGPSSGKTDDLMTVALKQRVIPVSPNTFFAYLQVILLGLRGLSIEQEAAAIMQQLAQLRGDYDRFSKDFSVLGKHIKDARETFDRTDRSLDRLGQRLVDVEAPQTAALPMEEIVR